MALPLGLAVKSFADFDDQMRLVKAVTKSTGAEFDALTKVAAKLGRETSFTAKQVADGMVSLGRMGFSPKEIEQAIQPTLDLARATGTDLGEAADIAANSMRIFGIEAGKMSSVADILTATANGSAQTLTDLFEALKMAGPQAKAAGENITDTSAAIGILANLGIKGSLAGTALRKSFSQFAKTDVQEKLKAVGVATVDASGNLRKMKDIMADIGRVMAAMPSAEKIAFAEEIFDIRGSLAGLSLGGNVKELDAFIAKLQDINGTAKITAEEMDAGLGGSFRKLMSAIEGAMNAIGKALEGTLQPLVNKLTGATLAVIEWIEANQGMVTAFAATVAGAAALGAALIAIGVAAKGAAAGIAVVHTAIKGFTFLQGMAIAQGMSLKNTLSLVAQAFANYRNLAIPSLVGTEQLCAAFGATSSAASRTAASLILMSNAEAAATAKSMLAAKWHAACVAMKNVSLATLTATAATKAQTIAEAASALSAKVLSGTRAFAASVTGLFSVANLKAAASATAGAGANWLLALSTKAVAAGYLAATAAAAAFCAIPISWILIGVGAALAGVCMYLSNAARYTAQLSDKMEQLRQTGDDTRRTDEMRMERLKQLSEKQKLSNSEVTEAEKLIKTLSSRYGDFGASLDRVAGKLNLAAGAQNNFNEAMQRAALTDLDAEIAEYEANLKELQSEDESLLSYWNHNLWSQISGRQEEAIKQIEANGDRMVAYRKKVAAAKQRQKALRGGDESALTGEDATEANLQAENQRRSVAEQSARDAESRISQMDSQFAGERQSELAKEINSIQKLNDEYKTLIQKILNFELSKANQDKAKIAELEQKLAQSDAMAEERIAQAQEKAFGEIERNFRFAESDILRNRTDSAEERAVDAELRQNKDSGMTMLRDMIESYRQTAIAAKAQFEQELSAAKADGDIDDREKRSLAEVQSGYIRAESMLDKYEAKLREAQEGTTRAAENLKPQGSFFANALMRMIGNTTESARTAKATEEIAKNTKETNKVLKRLDVGSGLSFE